MSEVRTRGQLRRIHADRSRFSFENDYTEFTGALLESHLMLVDQLRMILLYEDLEVSRQAIRVIHVLSIHELAPDLIHLFKMVDAFEGRFIKNAILMALGRLHHEQISTFLLAVLQDPGETSYRITAVHILSFTRNIQSELALPLFYRAEDPTEIAEIRCHAIRGLLRHGGGPRVVSLLVPLLQDHYGDVRWTALRAFEKHGEAFFAPVIHPLLNDDYQGDELTTIGTLAQLILDRWASQHGEGHT